MLRIDDEVDSDDDNITIEATDPHMAYYHVPGSFPSTLQGLTYLIFKTALRDRHHHPPY